MLKKLTPKTFIFWTGAISDFRISLTWTEYFFNVFSTISALIAMTRLLFPFFDKIKVWPPDWQFHMKLGETEVTPQNIFYCISVAQSNKNSCNFDVLYCNCNSISIRLSLGHELFIYECTWCNSVLPVHCLAVHFQWTCKGFLQTRDENFVSEALVHLSYLTVRRNKYCVPN